MSELNLDKYIHEFQTQHYPTPEETIKNNATVLYKRKKFFLGELRHAMKFLGFLLMVIVYLKDISMLRLLLRLFSQFTLSNPYPSSHLFTDDSKKGLSKFLLVSVLAVNAFCICIHLTFGAYKESPGGDKNYLHGGMSLEFIGERMPWGRLELLIYDGLILTVQLLFHYLMCFIDDSKILEVQKPSPVSPDANDNPSDWAHSEYVDTAATSDGYNGDVNLLTIDILGTIKTVMSYENRFSMYPTDINADGPVYTTVPGAYTSV
jgi:hypothetical protein